MADAGKRRKGVLVPVEGVKSSALLQEIASITLAALPGLIAKAPLMNCSPLPLRLNRLVAGGAGSDCLRAVARLGWRKGLISLVPSVLSWAVVWRCWR